ncbi:amidase signature domain-containing protein [Aspergillus pseudodeflectus]|uniref:Amidase signature domain-containing protein n=1 Tax=Aspergillus pseudodeflectus TaxID=176178 RepID=A0ABR4L3J7_9EURO
MEGYSQVFDQTMNPHNLSLGPGGSSSGEAAVVGFRGSILGLGSDIGGSIHAPSLYNSSVLTAQPWRRDSTAYTLPWRKVPRKTK